MTIHLPHKLETSILAAVRRGRFASLDDAMAEAASLLVRRLEQERGQASSPALADKSIGDEFAEIAASVPTEEWAKLPADGSEQHDHYIYGTPKRPPSR